MIRWTALAVAFAFTIELLPERIDLVSLVLQLAGLGALAGQLAAGGLGRDAASGARIGSLLGAGSGLFAGFLALLSRAVS